MDMNRFSKYLIVVILSALMINPSIRGQTYIGPSIGGNFAKHVTTSDSKDHLRILEEGYSSNDLHYGAFVEQKLGKKLSSRL